MTVQNKDTAIFREDSPTQHRLAQSYLGGCKPSDIIRARVLLAEWRRETKPAENVLEIGTEE